MKHSFLLLVATLLLGTNLAAQTPASYNQFKVITAAWQIAQAINTTPSNDPVYLVLAPGNYQIAQPIVIDRVGAVYIHGLSTGSTHLSDSIGFSGGKLFVVKKTQTFSLVGLTIKSNKTWRDGGILFTTNTTNTPHNVEIQEVEQRVAISIEAPGKYQVQSCRIPNMGYIVNHPDADFVMTGGQCWNIFGGMPRPENYPTPLSLQNPYAQGITPKDRAFLADSTCSVWQKQGRVRIYDANIVNAGNSYEFRFETNCHLGPHVIAGIRNENEYYRPSVQDCDNGAYRNYKAVAKVTGAGNRIIFKSNSNVSSPATFNGSCAKQVAFVDFQATNGEAYILGNSNVEGCNNIIMNSANTNLGNAKIVLLGNKIASLPAYPNMSNSTTVPQSLYANIQLNSGNSIINMGNMTRLNTGVHPLTGNYLTGTESSNSYGDELFSDLFLNNQDSIQAAPVIPKDLPPHALTLPDFALSYNVLNPYDVNTNHELLWRNILINVRNYGATPNDNTDDFHAIQAAIDTAVLSNGLLYFPKGTYDLSKTLQFNTLIGLPKVLKSTSNHYGSPLNIWANSERSILIAGENSNNTTINGLNNVLSIFSITNSRLSRMQGLTLRVNNGNIKAITGLTSSTNPSQAIVAVDPLCTGMSLPGISSSSMYLWNFRNCNFLGGQVGLSTHFRTQIQEDVHNPITGLNDIAGIYSGKTQSGTCSSFSGQLGESFAITNCNFSNNNIGFAIGWNQAFCHFISDCTFDQDSFGIAQYSAKGLSLKQNLYSGYNTIKVGGNVVTFHSNFNSKYRDFSTFYQEQSVPDYFNNCTFGAPTALFYVSESQPSAPNSWVTYYGRNKNTFGFVENCNFTYDHTQDALIKNQAFNVTPQLFANYSQRFTFFIGHRNSLFCLNSDLTKTTFVKGGYLPPTIDGVNTARLQGVGYGMIVQSLMPGNNTAAFMPYGSKISNGFNFSPNSASLPANNPPYPFGYGTTPPASLFSPRYVPKEIVKLDQSIVSDVNDYYFWRAMINLKSQTGLLVSPELFRDFALPMQRILLYNAGNQTTTKTKDIESANKIELRLFPNPAQDILNVKFQSENTAAAELKVCDILGRTLYTEKITMATGLNHFTLNLADFENGLLLICLTTRNGSVSKKMVKN